MVPWRNEPPRRREAAARGRGLPGSQEHHQPRLLRPDRHAQWTCQTPAAGGPRRHGRVKVHAGFPLLYKNKKNMIPECVAPNDCLLFIFLSSKVRTKDHVFDSISHLIGHHRDNNLPIVSAGSELCLLQPVGRKH